MVPEYKTRSPTPPTRSLRRRTTETFRGPDSRTSRCRRSPKMGLTRRELVAALPEPARRSRCHIPPRFMAIALGFFSAIAVFFFFDGVFQSPGTTLRLVAAEQPAPESISAYRWHNAHTNNIPPEEPLPLEPAPPAKPPPVNRERVRPPPQHVQYVPTPKPEMECGPSTQLTFPRPAWVHIDENPSGTAVTPTGCTEAAIENPQHDGLSTPESETLKKYLSKAKTIFEWGQVGAALSGVIVFRYDRTNVCQIARCRAVQPSSALVNLFLK